jgi:citrate synthase
MAEWIGAAEAAGRLHIKPASLYSYVSRGVLTRRTAPDGRTSLFLASEVEALARRGRPRRGAGPAELVIETALTEIADGSLRYRGHDVIHLAATHSFEAVAALLWTGSLDEDAANPPWHATDEAVAAGTAAQAGLPAATLPLERLAVIVPAMAATDPLRLQLDPPAVQAAARAMIAGMVECLPTQAARATWPSPVPPRQPDRQHPADQPESDARHGQPGPPRQPGLPGATVPPVRPDSQRQPGLPNQGSRSRRPGQPGGPEPGVAGRQRELGGPGDGGRQPAPGGPGDAGRQRELGRAGEAERLEGDQDAGRDDGIAARLAARLSARPLGHGLTDAIRAALVLVADHELAASTLAARVAASVRADPYAVVAAGLGALGGWLHGGASLGAEVMLAAASEPSDAPRVVGDLLRRGERIPGFGHFVYRTGDPRAVLLLELIRRAAPDSGRLAVADAVLSEARRRALPQPNIDFALAVLGSVAGLDAGAGEAIFAVARTAGWLAHALEEYARDRPIRPRGIYTGPAAASLAGAD